MGSIARNKRQARKIESKERNVRWKRKYMGSIARNKRQARRIEGKERNVRSKRKYMGSIARNKRQARRIESKECLTEERVHGLHSKKQMSSKKDRE